MDIDQRVRAIAQRSKTPPDSLARAYLSGRGIEREVAGHLVRLETAVASLVAAFYGDLEGRAGDGSSWVPYLADKAEVAATEAGQLAYLADLAASMPDPDA